MYTKQCNIPNLVSTTISRPRTDADWRGPRGAATIKTTHTLSLLRMDPAQQTPNLLSNNLGKRWRAERNFWISFLCFTLWWCGRCLYTVSSWICGF